MVDLFVLLSLVLITTTTTISGQGSFTTVCNNTVLSNGGETGGICYEVYTGQNLNWSSANAFCTANGGRLARILNEEMSIEIHRIIQGREDSHYWIGLSWANSTSEFLWSDGNGLEYERWRSGQPNASNNCVTVRNNSRNWVARDCTFETSHICEKDVCEGWTVRDGICYRKFNSNVRADAAVAFCRDRNSYLAEIPNIYVNNVILEIIDDDDYHIGLRTDGSKYYWRIGNFSLGDDTPSNGDRNRFGIIGEGMEDRWDLVGLGGTEKFICMIGPLKVEAPTQMCNDSPADTHVYEGVCYTRILANSRNLDIATLTCNNYNGILYTFDNTTLNMELRTRFGSGNDIKIQNPEEYNLFVPQEGYFNLYTGRLEQSYPDMTNCLIVDSNGNVQQAESNCNEQVNYICMSEVTPPTISTIPEDYNYTFACENNVIANMDNIGGICYETFNGNMNWNDASTNCTANGGRLARILNGKMSIEVERIIQDTSNYWIGLNRESTTDFQWSDGTSSNDNRWSSGHPKDGYNCASVRRNSTDWFSRNCSEEIPYICEKDVCEGWTIYNGICYRKFDSTTTWTDSVEYCANQTAFLAEIPNIHVNNIINILIGGDQCYIGLHASSDNISWRIGNFSISNPSSTIVYGSTMEYGSISNPGIWTLDNGEERRCAVCMRGAPLQEYLQNKCRTLSDIRRIYKGNCYIRYEFTPIDPRLAILKCNNFNGKLYRFDNNDLNMKFHERYILNDPNVANNSFVHIQTPDEYPDDFQQVGYFNLLSTVIQLSSTDIMCNSIMADGSLSGQFSCQDSIVLYFCKTDYDPITSILLNMTINETEYWSVSDNKNWTEADEYCRNEGGYLLNTTSQQVVEQLISTNNEYFNEYYWTGINVTSISQPNVQELCVAIDKTGTEMNLECSKTFSYICQKPLTQPTQQTPTPTPTTPTTIATTPTPDRLITVTMNATVNCADRSVESYLCIELYEVLTNTTATIKGVALLLKREELVKDLFHRITISTGVLIEIMAGRIVLVIVRLKANLSTTVHVGDNAIQTNSNSFGVNTTLIVLSETYNKTNELTNNSVRIVSDLITIRANSTLLGNLTIKFSITDHLKELDSGYSNVRCVFLTKESTWSTEGITTDINSNGNGSVECTTSHITTFAVLVSTASQCEIHMGEIPKLLLQITSYFFLSISLLFLLTSLLIFMFSGKKFFRIDINVMHFNHTVSILLAIFLFIFGAELFAEYPVLCTIVAFLLHFLWINVFLSSLGIAILLIYSIWIVGLKIPRKLSPALIPICWYVSFIWAGIWLIYGKFVAMGYLDSEIDDNRTNKTCQDPCFISTRNNLIWTFLVPIYVVLLVNIIILILVLFKIRIGLKRKNKMQSELMRVRKLALGAIVLIPTLSLPFIVSLPLAFLEYYHDNQFISTVFLWAYVFSTTPIGIVHFFLVTYRIPEAKFPKFCTKHSLRESTAVTTVDTLKSTLPRSNENGNNTLKLNVRRPIAKVPSIVIVNEHFETLC